MGDGGKQNYHIPVDFFSFFLSVAGNVFLNLSFLFACPIRRPNPLGQEESD